MKKVKLMGVSAAVLSAVALLTACSSSNKGSDTSTKAPTKYAYVYTTEPSTFDYLQSNLSADSDIFCNFVDGLMENDPSGNYVGALAKSWSVSDDGKTYTYHLRKNINWANADGSVYAPIKASDFVAGLQHAVEVKSEMLYLVQPLISGLDDYVTGASKDFSSVGIKADDEAGTVTYTLNNPAPYWNSLTTYPILFPVNSDFLKSKGEDFGKVSSPDNVLYSGPFVLSNFTSKSVVELKSNPSYWDKKNVHITDIKWNYYDGAQPASLFTQYDKGVYTVARVYPNDPSYKNVEKNYKDNINYSLTTPTTYNLTFNLNRQAYKLTKKTSSEEKTSAAKAILNHDFRAAINYSIDRISYNAQASNEQGGKNQTRNSFTMPNLVSVDGKPYSDAVKAELDKIDSSLWKDVDMSDGNNSKFNESLAKSEFAKAKETLEAEGVKFPIHLDLPQQQSSVVLVNQAKSLKQSIESTLGKENVVVDLNLTNDDDFYAATYMATSGEQSDFDISTASGWGPDYIDPATFLNIYDSRHGDMLQTLGLIGTDDQASSPEQAAAIKAVGLDEYDQLLDAAAKITDTSKLNDRYKAYAKAEAYLDNTFIQIPLQTAGGTPNLSNVVPFSSSYGLCGISNALTTTNSRLKYTKLQDKPVTQAQYDKAKTAFLKANEKAKVLDEVKE
ncbi:MAG: peptide ABC transporter substrate-binding protein [Streptococcaceae bacterium]|jgi:oligopeptide transport system substrate-binding protein|nr:peptide ABC transporter substrate-binding protein [Streptococcaceae bacterium]